VTNTLNTEVLPEGDFRKTLPRYQEEYRENNNKLSAGFAELSTRKGCLPAQLALAWILAQGTHIIPIPGTKKRKYLEQNAGSVDVVLSADDFRDIDELLARYPNTGDRYNEAAWKQVDKS
jgi:aryl-alcohol dehydrogenase-like predicted oxidoreductase